jgi:hypothetical protein
MYGQERMEVEQFILEELKRIAGLNFVSNLSKMRNDVLTFKDHKDSFKKWFSEQKTTIQTDIAPRIITRGAWPQSYRSSAQEGFKFPPKVVEYISFVEKWFQIKIKPDAMLMWIPQFAKSDLKFGKYTFVLMGDQFLSILFVYNQPNFLANGTTIQNLKEICQMDNKHFNKYFVSLLRNKILVGERAISNQELQQELDPALIIKLNKNYSNKKTRIVIMAEDSKTKKSSSEESSGEDKKLIEQDRLIKIQASMVRIMKSRKSLTFQELQPEVINDLKIFFIPQPVLMKRAMELLIEKEYLQRDPKQASTLHYKA